MMSQNGPTLLDVARQAGVSKATVSMVLNGSNKISPKTFEKVRAVMDGLQYRPNPVARKLAQKRWPSPVPTAP